MSETNTQSKKLGKVWWISAGAVFLVAVMAIIIFVNPAKPQTHAAAPTLTTEKPAGGCDVPAGDTSGKPAMPKDLRWAAAKGWTWPVSDTYGPTQTKNGYGICFARSPLGAALAMSSFYAATYTVDSKKTLDLYLMDSPGKTVALGKASTPPSSDAGIGPIGFAGFITDSYTPDEAQVTMVFAVAKSSTGYIGIPATLRWVDGDWKIKVLDNGTAFAGVGTKPASGQFVTWGGTGG